MSEHTPHDSPIDSEWYETAFDALYPLIYAHRTVEAAAPEVRFAIDRLGLQPEHNVLDLACGNGRHLVHLVDCVACAAGLDYSAELLQIARHQLGRLGRLVRADMRSLPFSEGAFDAVLNFFTSFGYFPTDAENREVVRGIARVLKPDGVFLLDFLNPPYVESTLVPYSTREEHGFVIDERRWINRANNRINKTTEVKRGGKVVMESGGSVQLYDYSALHALFREAGLQVEAVYGDFDGADLDADQPRMILIGRKA